MLDLRLLRERTDFAKAELVKVGFEPAGIDAILSADGRRRALIQEVEALRAKRAEVSKTIGKQNPETREQLKNEMRAVGDRITALERDLGAVEEDLNRQLLELPNLPD